MSASSEFTTKSKLERVKNATGLLRWAALFLGEMRDGLTMLNMQSAFLIVAKGYNEKQIGIMFLVFGASQFMAQAPAGYLYDYTEQKILWLSVAGVSTTILTVFTAICATDQNFLLMVIVKFIQGAITSFIPPGLNSITQGIVGTVGMTGQVAVNEMMNHLGASIIVLSGSLIAFALFPDIGILFIVSPIACIGFLYFLNKIDPADIDHDAARGLTAKADDAPKLDAVASEPAANEGYVPPADGAFFNKDAKSEPSFIFGFGGEGSTAGDDESARSNTPLQVLRDPILLLFIVISFLFHAANGTILPLVMQTLAIGNGRSGILMSGLCIVVAQLFMVFSAKICGTYSHRYGRKWLFVAGLSIVPIRCAILIGLLVWQGANEATLMQQALILSTQILDGIGAGTFGTMYILVTSDISKGTGRFGMSLGLTTAAMNIGGTVSGYMGQALAEEKGYLHTFEILMVMSIIPMALYLVFMPETLPESARTNDSKIASITEEEAEAVPAKGPTGNYIELV